MRKAICAALSAFFIVGCNGSETIKNVVIEPTGPFYGSYSIIELAGSEFTQSTGPYLTRDECNAFVLSDAKEIEAGGGTIIFSTCVESDIKGIPLEPVEFDRTKREI